MNWLTPYWADLHAGQKVHVPFQVHPSYLGFTAFTLAEDVGQVENWGLSLKDGSRLHLWLMRDGRWIMHRDGTDPSRGVLPALIHLFTETSAGAVLGALGALSAVAFVISKA